MLLPSLLRFRYSLRALLVFITLFCLWGGWHADRSYRERRAEEALLRRGANLCREAHISIWRYRFVTELKIEGPLDHEVINSVANLPYLTALHLVAPRTADSETNSFSEDISPRATMTPDSLAKILRRKNLRSLSLEAWIIPDEACAAIARQKYLEQISILFCEPTESGFARIVKAPPVRVLRARFCMTTGRELAGQPGSTTLADVDCRGTPVSTEFASFLAICTHLHSLDFGALGCGKDHSPSGDEFLAKLGPHRSIETLVLSSSSVTDRSVGVIVNMPRLSYLSLPQTVSTNGKNKILSSKPHLHGQF
jgi:hypothetical protein